MTAAHQHRNLAPLITLGLWAIAFVWLIGRIG